MIELPQIEILYAMILSITAFFGILSYTRKISVGIALLSIIFGVGISLLMAPYMQLVIAPIGDYLFYGYTLNTLIIVSIFHLISMIAMIFVAGYNLIRSGGKITWS